MSEQHRFNIFLEEQIMRNLLFFKTETYDVAICKFLVTWHFFFDKTLTENNLCIYVKDEWHYNMIKVSSTMYKDFDVRKKYLLLVQQWFSYKNHGLFNILKYNNRRAQQTFDHTY